MWLEAGGRGVAMFVLGAAAFSAAHAGPPFLTDDPEPVDRHHVEINVIAQRTNAVGGRSGSVSGEVNVGCAAETQCHLALPVTFNDSPGGPTHAGLGDVELGVKYRFFGGSGDGWSAAMYPTLDLPTGDAGRGLGNGRAQLLLPIWVQRSSGEWSWDAGIGRLINRAPVARNSWFTGLLVRRSLGERLSLGGELYRRTPSAVDEPPVVGFNIGAIVSVSPHQNLLISAGRGLTHAELNKRSMFLAYQLEL